YISKKAFKEQFDPSKFPMETYLLCELRWGENGTPWTHWVKNNYDFSHAEVYFLEKIFRPKRFNNYVKCHITLYLSWSPCATCCYRILDFLYWHPYVSIDIYVARLYCTDYGKNRRGLRKLVRSGQVKLEVMEEKGKLSYYKYCWKTFIQGDAADDFWTMNFQSEITKNRLKLCYILQVSRL
ncbi:ABEC1 enzyme, partial [Grallaria varia]|nr:ABEC1 enzyme [Grallaria varia]